MAAGYGGHDVITGREVLLDKGLVVDAVRATISVLASSCR